MMMMMMMMMMQKSQDSSSNSRAAYITVSLTARVVMISSSKEILISATPLGWSSRSPPLISLVPPIEGLRLE